MCDTLCLCLWCRLRAVDDTLASGNHAGAPGAAAAAAAAGDVDAAGDEGGQVAQTQKVGRLGLCWEQHERQLGCVWEGLPGHVVTGLICDTGSFGYAVYQWQRCDVMGNGSLMPTQAVPVISNGLSTEVQCSTQGLLSTCCCPPVQAASP